MADNEFEPPGWPFNEQPPAVPPLAPPFEPPSTNQAPPPAGPRFEPPHRDQVPPPPGAGPGQPPPPPPGQQQFHGSGKKRRSLWLTLGICFAVLALGVGACTAWFVSTVKAPVDEANRFLAQVDAGDYPAALNMMTTACDGSTVDLAVFDEIFGGAPIDYNLNSSLVSTSDATVSGSFSSSNWPADGIEIYLRDRDGWKVCGFRVR